MVRATVNGISMACEVEARTPLVDMLRNELGLRGTKVSCGVQICGSCTVLVDGLPVSSCTYLAVDVDQRQVLTIEGVAPEGRESSVVQDAFVEAGAIQCGYCTPGYVLAVTALLNEDPDPSDDVAKHYLDGNICRCTGYGQILDAVHNAARACQEVRP
jgi:aerobic-type carbon monoxide dehydrogenase small subunit (CoxS/CutS family)